MRRRAPVPIIKGRIHRLPGRPCFVMSYTDERGVHHRHLSTGATSERAAGRALEDALEACRERRRNPSGAHADGSELLVDFMGRHERDHVANLAEKRTRTIRLRRWLDYFGTSARLSDITKPEIERYVAARLAKGKAPATVTREIAALGAMLSKAVDAGLIPANPTARMKRLRGEGMRTRHLDEDESDALLVAAGESRSAHLLPMVLLALDAGGRLGEIAALTRQDVDLRAGIVAFVKTKSARTRHVHMTTRLAACLRPWMLAHPEDRLFPSADIRRAFHLARERAGLGEDVVYHSLRHTFATRLAARSVPIPVLQRLLGHSTTAMTMRYAHTSDRQAKDAINLLNRDTSMDQKRISE